MTEYVIFAVPVATPLTMPDEVPIVATEGLELDHVPPVISSDNDTGALTQIAVGPEIGSAMAVLVMVIIFLAVSAPHEFVTLYIIVSMPDTLPVTTPEKETVAFVLLTNQVPPETTSVSETLLPVQTVDGPVMEPAEGKGFTLTTAETAALPQVLVIA